MDAGLLQPVALFATVPFVGRSFTLPAALVGAAFLESLAVSLLALAPGLPCPALASAVVSLFNAVPVPSSGPSSGPTASGPQTGPLLSAARLEESQVLAVTRRKAPRRSAWLRRWP